MFATIAFRSAFRAPRSALDFAYAFSPRVEQTAPDLVTLDINGLAGLFGTPRQMAQKIVQRAAAMGIAVSVGLAWNPDAAAHAARGFEGITTVPLGSESSVLGKLPIQALGLEPEVEETLRLWGVRTFTEFARLPELGVAERLGSAGVRWRKLAAGQWERALVPLITAPEFERSMELDYSVAELEPLSFLLASLLNQVCAALETSALATNELKLRLKLDGGNEHERVLRLPVPMRDARAFLKLFQLELEKHPPSAGVVALALRAEAVPPRATQHGLYVPLAPEPQKLEITLARIAKLVGKENVGSPELLDTHRPDAFRITNFGTPRPSFPISHSPFPIRLGFRLCRPALPAQVDVQGGAPVRISARGVHGRVAAASGPWRSSGDWWAHTAWARDEWDIRLDAGAFYRIYRELNSGAWFVDGSYD